MWICEECKSYNVSQKAWVTINENSPTIDFIEDDEYWCNNCNEYVNIEEVK